MASARLVELFWSHTICTSFQGRSQLARPQFRFTFFGAASFVCTSAANCTINRWTLNIAPLYFYNLTKKTSTERMTSLRCAKKRKKLMNEKPQAAHRLIFKMWEVIKSARGQQTRCEFPAVRIYTHHNRMQHWRCSANKKCARSRPRTDAPRGPTDCEHLTLTP